MAVLLAWRKPVRRKACEEIKSLAHGADGGALSTVAILFLLRALLQDDGERIELWRFDERR